MEEKPKRDLILPISILIAGLMIAVAVVYNAGEKTNNQTANPSGDTKLMDPKDIDLSAVAFMGKSDAPVTLIEYSDYQCPICARFFEQTEAAIKQNYVDTGKVKFVYKDMAFLGPESVASAEAAACAQDQGKFWEFHDALFNAEIKEAQTKGSSENTGNLTRPFFIGLAKTLGLNVDDFASCVDSNKYKDRVQKETDEAGALLGPEGGTPSFFLNGKLLSSGIIPLSSFQQAIEQVLGK